MGPAGHLHQNALPELPAALAECPGSALQDAFGFHFINFATHKWARGWPQNLSPTSVLMGKRGTMLWKKRELMVLLFCYQVFSFDPSMLLCTCNPSIQEAEAGGLPQAQDHPWLHIEFLSKGTK